MAVTMPLTQTNPERIRSEREKTGQPLVVFADALPVAPDTLRKLEKKACTRVDHFILRRLADRFGVPIDELLQDGK